MACSGTHWSRSFFLKYKHNFIYIKCFRNIVVLCCLRISMRSSSLVEKADLLLLSVQYLNFWSSIQSLLWSPVAGQWLDHTSGRRSMKACGPQLAYVHVIIYIWQYISWIFVWLVMMIMIDIQYNWWKSWKILGNGWMWNTERRITSWQSLVSWSHYGTPSVFALVGCFGVVTHVVRYWDATKKFNSLASY